MRGKGKRNLLRHHLSLSLSLSNFSSFRPHTPFPQFFSRLSANFLRQTKNDEWRTAEKRRAEKVLSPFVGSNSLGPLGQKNIGYGASWLNNCNTQIVAFPIFFFLQIRKRMSKITACRKKTCDVVDGIKLSLGQSNNVCTFGQWYGVREKTNRRLRRLFPAGRRTTCGVCLRA